MSPCERGTVRAKPAANWHDADGEHFRYFVPDDGDPSQAVAVIHAEGVDHEFLMPGGMRCFAVPHWAEGLPWPGGAVLVCTDEVAARAMQVEQERAWGITGDASWSEATRIHLAHCAEFRAILGVLDSDSCGAPQ